jgi:hypothetical protein
MVITQSDFVHSIRFLKEFQQKNNPNQIHPIKPNAKTREKGLEHIGSVLKAIVTPPGPISPGCGSDEKLCNRILALEKKLEVLAQRIEEIAKSLS